MKYIKTYESYKHGTLYTEYFDEDIHIPLIEELANKYGFIKKDKPTDWDNDIDIEKEYGYWERTPRQYFYVYKPEYGDVSISYVNNNRSGYMDVVEFLKGVDNFDDSNQDNYFEKLID